ncbi:MAG TPA: YkvA family protein [Longimicrobiaceae bacterium]
MHDQPADLPEVTRFDASATGNGDLPSIQRPRLRRRERAEVRDRETMKQLIRDLPKFLKLLWALYRDPRVSLFDKGLVLATIAYILMPMDFVPDFIPVLGQVDDIYLLALALDRLLNNAGVDVLMEHWEGEIASLEMAIAALDKAGSFLPEQVRNLLHQKVT